jgi:hypothetical protein
MRHDGTNTRSVRGRETSWGQEWSCERASASNNRLSPNSVGSYMYVRSRENGLDLGESGCRNAASMPMCGACYVSYAHEKADACGGAVLWKL